MVNLFDNKSENKPAQVTNVEQEQTAMSDNLQKAYEMAKGFFPSAVESATKAKAALSTITAISSDEQDANAEAVLVKVRKTYEMMNKNRLAFTGIWDKEILPRLMGPEKSISTDAKA